MKREGKHYVFLRRTTSDMISKVFAKDYDIWYKTREQLSLPWSKGAIYECVYKDFLRKIFLLKKIFGVYETIRTVTTVPREAPLILQIFARSLGAKHLFLLWMDTFTENEIESSYKVVNPWYSRPCISMEWSKYGGRSARETSELKTNKDVSQQEIQIMF